MEQLYRGKGFATQDWFFLLESLEAENGHIWLFKEVEDSYGLKKLLLSGGSHGYISYILLITPIAQNLWKNFSSCVGLSITGNKQKSIFVILSLM